MKQTAVESIIEKLNEHKRQSAHNELGTNRTGEYRIGLTKAIEFCEEHLEMGKQQIIQFADKYDDYVFQGGTLTTEQYYNEIYGGEK